MVIVSLLLQAKSKGIKRIEHPLALFMKPQKMGNCFYYVTKPLLRQLCQDKIQYKQLHLDLKFQSLVDFYEASKPNLGQDAKARWLLKEAASKLSNSLKKNRYILDKGKLEKVKNHLTRITNQKSL